MAAAAAILIRPGEKQDVHFLRDLVRHTGLERAGVPIDEEPPPLSLYVSGWGRAGDASVIALDEATHVAVGAAWYRLFTADEHGFAFVDEATPEMTIAVVPNRRGQGIGERLVQATAERARQAGFAALSLSVAQDDPVMGLFEKCGFRVVDERGTAVTMLLDLA